MFYPRETLKLNVTIDNSKCKKDCEKFIVRLIRRIEIYDLKKKSKLFLCHDHIAMEKEYTTECKQKGGTT